MANEDGGGNRAPDAYEAKYMQSGGEVIYRDKMKSPWWMSAMFLAPVPFVWIIYAIGGSKPAPVWVPLILTPLFMLFWLLFSVLRVTVTKTNVVVQYGLFGPTIPIDAIVSHEEVDYDAMKTSYGIHKGPDGSWVYNMFGDGAHGVKIVYRAGGKQKSVIVGTTGAAQIAAAISQARGGVRVEAATAGATATSTAVPSEVEAAAPKTAEQPATRL